MLRRKDATEINLKISKIRKLKDLAVLNHGRSNKYCFQCKSIVNLNKNEPQDCIRFDGYFHNGKIEIWPIISKKKK